jgi:hypothetical protein
MIDALIAKVVAELVKQLAPKLAALLPILAAAIAKAVIEQVTKAIPTAANVIADPAKLTEDVRSTLDKLIPDIIDIPGFEWTDFWRPKK